VPKNTHHNKRQKERRKLKSTVVRASNEIDYALISFREKQLRSRVRRCKKAFKAGTVHAKAYYKSGRVNNEALAASEEYFRRARHEAEIALRQRELIKRLKNRDYAYSKPEFTIDQIVTYMHTLCLIQ
jgi:hypothetical protein